MATSRSIVGSCALRTMPIPPCPRAPETWYFPRDFPTQACAIPLLPSVRRMSAEVSARNGPVSRGLNSGEGSPGFAGAEDSGVFSGVMVLLGQHPAETARSNLR
jgi:hypothetical protein